MVNAENLMDKTNSRVLLYQKHSWSFNRNISRLGLTLKHVLYFIRDSRKVKIEEVIKAVDKIYQTF